MTDCDWAALRPETAVLMLAASAEPDEDDVLTVRVRHEPGDMCSSPWPGRLTSPPRPGCASGS